MASKGLESDLRHRNPSKLAQGYESIPDLADKEETKIPEVAWPHIGFKLTFSSENFGAARSIGRNAFRFSSS